MNPLLTIPIAAAAIALILIIIVLVRTSGFAIETETPAPLDLANLDGEAIAERIGLAVQHRTIANTDPEKTDPAPFNGLHDLLRTLYPQVFERLSAETINRHALLFTWPGQNPALNPVAFAAHQDVVPANESPDSGWTHPPFSGETADGFVWGRGTLDCKGTLIGQLEAVNNLIKSGYQPLRTIYLCFGDDEEVSGLEGAKSIVETLQSRGVKLAFLLDEGGTVGPGDRFGIETPIAQIGISEKGYLSLKLKAKVAGGHSATPPTRTAIGALGLAVAALESNPFPQVTDVAQFIMRYLGKALPFGERMRYANPWLFGGAVKRRLASKPNTNALSRTTTAPTLIKAGTAENVLPPEAEALVNFRIMPGETVRSVYERVNGLVGDAVISVLPVHGDVIENDHAWNPTPVADVDSPHFAYLSELVQACFPGTAVVPTMMLGATDARHYAPICQNAFRFSPVFLTHAESETMHAVNERLSFVNAARMVAFYQELIRLEGSLSLEAEQGEIEVGEEAPETDLVLRPLAEGNGGLERIQPSEVNGGGLPDTAWEMEPLPDDDAPLEVKPLRKE